MFHYKLSLLDFDKLIRSGAEAELCGALDGVDTVTGLDALDELIAAGIGGVIYEVKASLVDGNRSVETRMPMSLRFRAAPRCCRSRSLRICSS